MNFKIYLMNQWIFVLKDDVSVLNKRSKAKKWPIFYRTINKQYLKIGDHIIFYQAGYGGQKFLGTAVNNSKVQSIPDSIDGFVDIDKIDIWKKDLSIKNILSNLNFIKNKEHWGAYLQGGVVRLSKQDYAVILKAAKK